MAKDSGMSKKRGRPKKQVDEVVFKDPPVVDPKNQVGFPPPPTSTNVDVSGKQVGLPPPPTSTSDNLPRTKRKYTKKSDKKELHFENANDSPVVNPTSSEEPYIVPSEQVAFKGFDPSSKKTKTRKSKNQESKLENQKPADAPQEPTIVEPEVVSTTSFDKEAKKLKANYDAQRILENHKKFKNPQELKNMVKHKYTVSDANHVWCSDWTIGGGGNLFILIILDLSSRLIISSSVLNRQPNGSDIEMTLLKGIQCYGVTPKVFHTDCGGGYMSNHLAKFLREKKIMHSHRDPGDDKFDNQVVESLNHKLWSTLENEGFLDSVTKTKRFFLAQKEDINHVVNCVIEKINLDKPPQWKEGSPRELYGRLVDHPYEYGIMAKSKTSEAEWVKAYQEYLLVQGQAEDLTQVISEERETFDPFIESISNEFDTTSNLSDRNIVKLLERARSFRALMVHMNTFFKTSFTHLGHQQVNTAKTLKIFQDEVDNSHRLLQEKENTTSEVIKDLTKEIQKLRELSERKDREAEVRKQKRAKRNRKPLRDAFTFDDLTAMLKDMSSGEDKSSIAVCRDRVCLVFLFLTGIRVAELKELTIANLDSYLDLEPIDIQIGKSNSPVKQQLVPSEESRNILRKYVGSDINILAKKLGHGSYLCALSREHLTRRINNLMRLYGKKVNKELTSHSCRISFVTRYVQEFGIDVARQMVGHVNVSTTQNYSRSMLTPRQKAGYTNRVLSAARDKRRTESVSTETAENILIEAEDN
jgi:site-specific recombinase XerD/transposase InsO family protein